MTTQAPRFDTIAYEVTDGIAVITLDRPEVLNAVSLAMVDELVASFDLVDEDDEVRAAVITGRGRAFCAGADLSGGEEIFAREDDQFSMARDADGGGVLSRRMFACTKPLIAAINGPAVGMGLSMCLPMDIRVSADTARFGFVFTQRGLIPEACSSWYLPRIVGISRAAEWVYSGRLFDAEEARSAGLVRSVHPTEDVLGAAIDLAHELTARSAPVSVALARRMLWEMLSEGTPELAHEIDSRGIAALGAAPDAVEGVQAFMDKREPRFEQRVSTDMPAFYRRWVAAGDTRSFLAGETP